jgi:hypothetical protein
MIANRSGAFKMPKKESYPRKSLPVANYGSALARALEWLGDRYLLAKPVNSVHRMPVDPGAVLAGRPAPAKLCSNRCWEKTISFKRN